VSRHESALIGLLTEALLCSRLAINVIVQHMLHKAEQWSGGKLASFQFLLEKDVIVWHKKLTF